MRAFPFVFSIGQCDIAFPFVFSIGQCGSLLRKHRITKDRCADLHTPDMNRVKLVRKQQHTRVEF